MPNAPPTHGDTCLIVQVLENHCAHTLLLPFVFDAIASLIVGNQDNGRKVRREAGLVAGGGWLGLARTGSVRLGLAGTGSVWLGLARSSSVWPGADKKLAKNQN